MVTNEYGLDVHYITKNLKVLLRDVKTYRPDEMRRALVRLAETCKPANTCPTCKGHNIRMHSDDSNWCNDCEKEYDVC